MLKWDVPKYDWLTLKDEYCRGRWLSVSQFLHSKNVPYNSRTRSNATGWRQDKIEYQRKVIAKTQEKTIESEAEIRRRQQKASLLLQAKGVEKIRDLSVDSIDDARKLITDGLIQERQALGLDEDNLSSTQINISLPSTEIDTLTNGKSYEEILGMIALIKKEKERRSKTDVNVRKVA